MGPLSGIRVVEIAGLGPLSYAGMVLADMGAEVIRVERPGHGDSAYRRARTSETMLRGRRSIVIDLRRGEGHALALKLIDTADVLIEAQRPGVMEKLGLGPDMCLNRNSRIVYGRLTGWGQVGPLADTAGHDINYIALSGALHTIGARDSNPLPPLGLVGDIAGGALHLALGVCAALVERQSSGRGQVIDAAMTDGALAMMTPMLAQYEAGEWVDERGANRLDGAAHFYRTYECADGKFVAVGAIEAKFDALLCAGLGIDPSEFPDRMDRDRWDRYCARLAEIFRTETRDHWCAVFDSTDACVSPVLALAEVADHPHHHARDSFVDLKGHRVPRPAPRFDRTDSTVGRTPAAAGADTSAVLVDLGFDDREIASLYDSGAVQGTTRSTLP
jgi:alpha-methylacyl-CoA racemase